MFIRSWIRLVSLNVSRHRAVVQKYPSAVHDAVNSLLEFIVHRNPPAEYGSALHEYLTAMAGSSPIADALQNAMCQRLESSSNASVLEIVLQVIVTLHGDLKRVATVMESALEHFEGPRSFLSTVLPVDGSKELASTCWKQGCFLSWYCLVTNQQETSAEDGPYALEQLLAGCKLLNLRYLIRRIDLLNSMSTNLYLFSLFKVMSWNLNFASSTIG